MAFIAEEFIFDDIKCIESLVGPYPTGLVVNVFYRPEGSEQDEWLTEIKDVKKRLSIVDKDRLMEVLRDVRTNIENVGNLHYVEMQPFFILHDLFS